MIENELVKKAEEIINKQICSSLAMHDGGVKVVSLQKGILRIKLIGTCHGCPSATVAIESLISKEVCSALPEIKRVDLESRVSVSLIKQARELLKLQRAE